MYFRLLYRFILLLKTFFIYKPIFGYINIKASINNPLRIDKPRNIHIGHASIGYKTWLAATPLSDAKECSLIVKDGCTIGNFNHIYATGKVIIEENVLTADKVYITDNLHSYEDIAIPILLQAIKQTKPVIIGSGSWLGENVCVLGAVIGKHCVIGSNSVVTRDIPDYCVAVGAPAYIIKRFNQNSRKWEKTDKDGNFLEHLRQ